MERVRIFIGEDCNSAASQVSPQILNKLKIMKRTLLLISGVLLLSSCQRSCQSIDRSFQTSSRQYEVIMYSGGKVVFKDKFTGIINDSKDSDGCYYTKNDTLIEVSGDYVIKSVD